MPGRSAPFLMAPGDSRRRDCILPFKLLARDSAGALSVCEFTLGGWESGPVLHLHTGVDEAFYVVRGRLEVQLGDERRLAQEGSFLWVPRGTPHTFANAGSSEVRVLALASPGGIEELFAEQAGHLVATDVPDPTTMDEIGRRHGALTVGPPITAHAAPGPH